MDLETNMEAFTRTKVYLEHVISAYRLKKHLYADSEVYVGPNPVLALQRLPESLQLVDDRPSWLQGLKQQIIEEVRSIYSAASLLLLIIYLCKQVEDYYQQSVLVAMDTVAKEEFIAIYGRTALFPANLHYFASKMLLYSTDLHRFVSSSIPSGSIPAAAAPPASAVTATTAAAATATVAPAAEAPPTPDAAATATASTAASTSNPPSQRSRPVPTRRTHHYTPVYLNPSQPVPDTVPGWVWQMLISVQTDVRLLEASDDVYSPSYPVSHFSNPLVRRVLIAGVMSFLNRWPHLCTSFGRLALPRTSFATASGRVSLTSYMISYYIDILKLLF